LLVVLAAPAGCVDSLFGRGSGYDSQQVSIQTVSLFNQRAPSRLSKKNWKGDWIFRRDRLELIDAEMRNGRPDLILMQEAMAKEGSPFESDRNILQAGALADYDWREFKVQSFEDTQEQQSLVIATGPTLTLAPPAPEGEREFWALGPDGYLAAATVDLEGQPLTVFNVQMPPQADGDYLWYNFIQQRINERLARFQYCRKRVVVAGLMPGDQGSRRFSEFMSALQLKDAAAGFCQIAANCFTATPMNDIYMATVGDESPSRLDRIFVHQTAVLYSSGLDFEDPDTGSRYEKNYGLDKLWPTQRFGWTASVRFARCNAKEMEEAVQ
jgi:hypothetical protein